MKFLETLKDQISGTPRVSGHAGDFRLTATHRLPSSGDEMITVFRIIGFGGAAAILVAQYRPDTPPDPNANIFLEFGNMVVAGLSNAVARLGDVIEQGTLDVPLESLHGWGLALAFLGGVTVFRHSGLFDLYTYLTNREHVRIAVDRETLTLRRGTYGLPKRFARDGIQDVLILPNHKTGHDVMLQHDGKLTRLASIFGDLTRPTLFKLKLEEALAGGQLSPTTRPDTLLQAHN
ncbi:MAG: hypothetical protein IE937_00750 [Gammaproteobacteria bacterium]|uniref:Uncharacterized protein n=1 Tax=Thioclava marina TaxID=1915077 RepID=A0ABX3MJM5_9RHOB|nr:hypothetical protein [Thioclava marina]MBD3754151.1 hypothetical protein [Gammaproteobacteria bacterium]OOY11766.1 hypothetical protein BMG00_11815 [Thioclava marina]